MRGLFYTMLLILVGLTIFTSCSTFRSLESEIKEKIDQGKEYCLPYKGEKYCIRKKVNA